MNRGRLIRVGIVLAAGGLAGLVCAGRAAGDEEVITILAPAKPAPPAAVSTQAVSEVASAPWPSLPPAPGAAVVPAGVPVGTVVAWLKAYTNTPSLPREWVECNGQALSLPGSPYHGAAIPNLNGAGDQAKRFLRGSTDSGAVGGAEIHNHGLVLMDRPAKRQVNVSSKDSAPNLPPYYEVTWIIKVL